MNSIWQTHIPLKPCPFCGGKAEMHHWRCSYFGEEIYPFEVRCKTCHTRVGSFSGDQISLTEKKAADLWNRRAKMDGKDGAENG